VGRPICPRMHGAETRVDPRICGRGVVGYTARMRQSDIGCEVTGPMEPMRIAFLITRADVVGGAAVHVRDLCVRLMADGHEPIVATGSAGVYPQMLAACGITHYPLRSLQRSLNPLADVKALLEVRAFLLASNPDILAAHSSKAGVLGRIAAAAMGLPVVFTAHGWAFTDGVPMLRRHVYSAIDRWTVPLADAVITVSEYDRRLALRKRVGTEHQTVTIHNGMPELASNALHAKPDGSPPQLVMVARFEAPKDHATLLCALSGLTALQWTLKVVGDGPLLGPTQRMAANLGLAHRVEFAGYCSDVAGVLAASHVFVLSSNWEGLPLTIVEAMRAGLPVIASDVGGVSELVEDGRTGYLVPAKSPLILAERLRNLLEDASTRRSFGGAGRRRFEESFTLECMYEKTLALYERVLARRGVASAHHQPA
jgi:glycosyltransferase involved in cell wall biosynthesis